MTQILRTKTASATASWVAPFKANPNAKLRLFCFPYAGGGSLIYHSWRSMLPVPVDVCPVLLPGREGRLIEAPFTSSESLVKAMAQGLLPYLDKPFAFFGHSMGALLSYELASLLRRQYNLSPVRLLVSARSAPQVPNAWPPIHMLPDREFFDELHEMNGTRKDVMENDELMQLMLPALRADFQICETYAYAEEPPLACPISAFGGLRDPWVTRDMLDAWRSQTTASFTLRMFPGDHFFLNTAQSLLIRMLSQDLSRAIDGIDT